MKILRVILGAIPLFAGAYFGRILLGAGLFSLTFGVVIGYFITRFVLDWIGVTSDTVQVMSVLAVLLLLSGLSILSIVLGIILMRWSGVDQE